MGRSAEICKAEARMLVCMKESLAHFDANLKCLDYEFINNLKYIYFYMYLNVIYI